MSRWGEIAEASAAQKWGERSSVMWFYRLKNAGTGLVLLALTAALGVAGVFGIPAALRAAGPVREAVAGAPWWPLAAVAALIAVVAFVARRRRPRVPKLRRRFR